MFESFDAMSGREAEARKEAVVAENVRRMDTEMMRLLNGESIGGNAGSVMVSGKEYPAAGANAMVERHTGKIVAFGNTLPPPKRETEAPIIFRVAFDRYREDGFFRITDVHPGSRRAATIPGTHRDDVLDGHAVDVLQRSIDRWNAEHEEDITQP